jgi:hypothetical protein
VPVRNHRELAERAGRAGDAERESALFGSKSAADHPEHDAVTGAGEPESEQQPNAQRKLDTGAGQGHEHEAERVQRGASRQYPPDAETVGDHARKRLRSAPDEILQRDCERESFAPQPNSAVIGCRKSPKP